MKSLKTIIAIFGLLFLTVSCSSDSSNSSSSSNGNVQVKATATYTNSSGRLTDNIALTSFKINIREIEFELSDGEGEHHHEHDGHDNGHVDGDDDHGFFNSDDDTELAGPWEVDLLNQTVPLTSVTVPNGTYEEVQFKLSPSLVSTSPIYNKTVEVTGTINGTPFVFWHNLNERFSMDYEDAGQDLVITTGTYDLVFNFDLNEILSHVNLSTAVDGNGNGVIEIGPDDTDGNNALATQFHQHIGGGCHMHDGPGHH